MLPFSPPAGTCANPLRQLRHCLPQSSPWYCNRRSKQRPDLFPNRPEYPRSTMDTVFDERVPGRLGSSILLVLPVETIDTPFVNHKCPNWRAHRQHILKILDRYGITNDQKVRIKYRQHSGTKLHDKYITILIVAMYVSDSKTT